MKEEKGDEDSADDSIVGISKPDGRGSFLSLAFSFRAEAGEGLRNSIGVDGDARGLDFSTQGDSCFVPTGTESFSSSSEKEERTWSGFIFCSSAKYRFVDA